MSVRLKKAEIRMLWIDFEADIYKLRNTALEILAHPEATPEQIGVVHASLVHVMQEYRRVRKEVEDKGLFNMFFKPDRGLQ